MIYNKSSLKNFETYWCATFYFKKKKKKLVFACSDFNHFSLVVLHRLTLLLLIHEPLDAIRPQHCLRNFSLARVCFQKIHSVKYFTDLV